MSSNVSDACEKCGKTFKGKRGLTMHMKVCEGTQNLVCEFCNKDFSSIYSLSIHSTRCSKSLRHQEEQEKIVKTELQKLQDKLKEIELKHQQEIKDLNQKIRADYEQQLKLRDDDLKSFSSELNASTGILKEREKYIQHIEGQLNELNVELRTVRDINAKLSLKDTNTTTIINNDNRVQLQSLDPSMIQGRINPPNYVIGNVNDFMSMLRALGVRNCFRVNDKSRGTLSWNKPGEGEIRDPKGDQLLTHIIDSLSDDLTKEKCYYEEELKKLYDADEKDLYLINESRAFVNFCTQLLRKDPDILNKIKKELVKQGRAKGDPELDEIREVSYNKLITSILTALFPNMIVWIEMTFFELGQHIGQKIKDRYHLEGASREDLYIVVHTDGGGNRQVFSKRLMSYISEAINMALDSDLIEQIVTQLLLHKAVNKERVERMIEYMKNPTVEATTEIMRGIVSL